MFNWEIKVDHAPLTGPTSTSEPGYVRRSIYLILHEVGFSFEIELSSEVTLVPFLFSFTFSNKIVSTLAFVAALDICARLKFGLVPKTDESESLPSSVGHSL